MGVEISGTMDSDGDVTFIVSGFSGDVGAAESAILSVLTSAPTKRKFSGNAITLFMESLNPSWTHVDAQLVDLPPEVSYSLDSFGDFETEDGVVTFEDAFLAWWKTADPRRTGPAYPHGLAGKVVRAFMGREVSQEERGGVVHLLSQVLGQDQHHIFELLADFYLENEVMLLQLEDRAGKLW